MEPFYDKDPYYELSNRCNRNSSLPKLYNSLKNLKIFC